MKSSLSKENRSSLARVSNFERLLRVCALDKNPEHLNVPGKEHNLNITPNFASVSPL